MQLPADFEITDATTPTGPAVRLTWAGDDAGTMTATLRPIEAERLAEALRKSAARARQELARLRHRADRQRRSRTGQRIGARG
jgi:hypothetical protein